jgi:WD40 repeat protein
LKLSPSGNFLWGGFSDGTLRVFDLSGTFGAAAAATTDNVSKSQRPFINSKLHQSYGAVACQIHARGVHTDLITTVDIAPDGKYVFCGVSRGAMELYAVHVGHLEEAVLQVKREELRRKKQRQESGGMASAQTTTTTATAAARLNMLDYIQVYCHSDAKLKGFGACTNAVVANQKKDGPTSYLLLTGKGIKNIHIWKFTPPKLAPGVVRIAQDDEDNGDWDQLYDTATNGNTIQLLEFYRTPEGKLVAASKSDLQKLRLWDLSFEEQAHQGKQRPKRPPYQDVDNSQAVLGLAGGFCVCGGDSMYNELSIVSLDQPNNAYNHTELALPTSGSGGSSSPTMGTSSRRQRRGEMKAVVSVAAPPQDSSHALLELDDVGTFQKMVVELCVIRCNFSDWPFFSVLVVPVGVSGAVFGRNQRFSPAPSIDAGYSRIHRYPIIASRLLETIAVLGEHCRSSHCCKQFLQPQHQQGQNNHTSHCGTR